MTDFTVENGRPIPQKGSDTQSSIWTALKRLEVDQCLFFPGGDKKRNDKIRKIAYEVALRDKMTVVTRTMSDGFRVWRTK